MSPRFKMLPFIILNTVLHLTRQTRSQCLAVYVSVTDIDSSLSPEAFNGFYDYDGIDTVSACKSYSSSSGQTLRYYAGSWSLSSATNDIFNYVTAAGVPCDPPLGTNTWTHGHFEDATIATTCSITASPSMEPTNEPTVEPTANPTTVNPTAAPSKQPSINPSNMPSISPSSNPSSMPSQDPSANPSLAPSEAPSKAPTNVPTLSPTEAPVIPPTFAPTDACSHITLLVMTISEMPSTVDGVYYIQTDPWPPSGYPYYTQSHAGTEASTFGVIYWDAGYWNIIDDAGVHLQYQLSFPLPTAYTPPHTAFTGNGWRNMNDGSLWTVLIECGIATKAPSSDPTMEPTGIPSETPTIEPTHQPTMGQPTFIPTLEPIATSIEGDGDDSQSVLSGFLDRFTVIEWAIIASLPLICLIICGSLYVWRSNKIDASQKEQQWHMPSAVNDKDEIEMQQKQRKERKSKPQQLQFEVQDSNKRAKRVSSLGALAGGGGHTPVNYKDEKAAADFSDALRVVATHKSKRSIDLKKKNEYQEVDNVMSVSADGDHEPDTSDVNAMMTYDDEERELNKQESEFYGDHLIDEIYSYTFTTKPFGMEWKTLKRDKKNLYVSKITPKSQAALGKIEVGSKLVSFNGEMIEDLGAKKIYAKLAITEMPLTITFLKPFKKEEDKEGDSFKPTDKKPKARSDDEAAAAAPAGSPSIPSHVLQSPPKEAPEALMLSADQALIPPKTPPIEENDALGAAGNDPFADIGDNPMGVVPTTSVVSDDVPQIKQQPTEKMMKEVQALIPEMFDDEEANGDNSENTQESFHAD